MADNVTLNAGSGGETCATDDVSGVQYQIIKLADGTANASTVIAAAGGVEANALRVTIASDSTGLLSVDDNGGSLTVDGTVAATQSGSWTVDLGATDNAVLDAIAASLAGTLTIAGAVTNAGTFAVQAAQTGTWTVDLGATDNAVLDAMAASLAIIDDAVYVDDIPFTAGSNKVMAAGFRYDDTTPDAVQQGDVGYARMSSRRELYTTIRDAAGNERGMVVDASGYITANINGTVTVGSHAVTNAGTFAVQAAQSGTWTVQPGNTANTTAWLVTGTGGTFPVSGVAAHGAAVSGNPVLLAGENPLGNVARLQTATDGDLIVHQHSDTVSLADDISNTPQVTINEDDAGILYTPTVGFMFDGTGWDRIRGTSADGLLVNLGSNNDVTITSGTVTTLANGQTAHDSAVTGSPLRVGAKAETALSGITLVADGDATDLHAGVDGVLITRPHCNLEDIVSGVAAITDGSSTSVIAAAGAGVKIYITSVIIANSSATAVSVDIRDGAAGTVKATLPAPPDMGGVVHALPVPLPFSANTAVCADPSASASTVTVTLIGFKSKV